MTDTQTAKSVKKELKGRFPGTKFGVTTTRTRKVINVYWRQQEGPAWYAVKAALNKFSDITFCYYNRSSR